MSQKPPTRLDYQALLARIDAAVQAYAAGEIDSAALRRRLNEINDQGRALDLLGRLHRAARRAAAGPPKPSPPCANS